jgi:DNA-binding LacI/PurR family transcriptional regulator
MTVSRALNNRSNVTEETKNKVWDMAREMGYRPNHIAKSLVLNKTFSIGVVIPEIAHSFFPEVIRGIEDVTYAMDYQLIFTHSAEDQDRERRALAALEAKRVDGILISTAQSTDDVTPYKELIDTGLPMVFFDRCVYNIGASCVSMNDVESSREITEHLIQHGYKKIAHLSGPPKVSIGKKRLDGFLKALKEHNLEIREKWIKESGFQEKGGYDAMMRLLENSEGDRPEAVVAVNDPAAFGAMQAILDNGLRIPEDIAIVGFTDDIRAKLMPVPLTTIRQPAYEMGKKAAEKLIKVIDNEDETVEEIVIESQLIIRQSCGCNNLNAD